AHALAQAELADRCVENRVQLQQVDQLVARAFVSCLRDPIDVAQQLERFDRGQVPPQLRALSEYYADLSHMRDPLAPRHPAQYLAAPAIRYENPRESLNGSGLAGAVRPDVSDKLPGLQR